MAPRPPAHTAWDPSAASDRARASQRSGGFRRAAAPPLLWPKPNRRAQKYTANPRQPRPLGVNRSTDAQGRDLFFVQTSLAAEHAARASQSESSRVAGRRERAASPEPEPCRHQEEQREEGYAPERTRRARGRDGQILHRTVGGLPDRSRVVPGGPSCPSRGDGQRQRGFPLAHRCLKKYSDVNV